MNDLLPTTVGFELEFGSPAYSVLDDLHRVMTERGIAATNFGRYRHTPPDGKAWDLKTDGSCGHTVGMVGYEAVSPVISTYTQLRQAAKVGEIIRYVGGSLNPRCGLHVHLGFPRHREPGNDAALVRERIFRFLSRYEDAFYMLVPPDRRNNHFCKHLDEHEINEIKRRKGNVDLGRLWHDKNRWINCVSLSRIGTLEFRFLEGSLDEDTIVGYAMFLEHLYDILVTGKKVSWGKAKARNNKMLFYTMLQQAGLYGKQAADPDRVALVRKWAVSRFTMFNDPEGIPAPVVRPQPPEAPEALEALEVQPQPQVVANAPFEPLSTGRPAQAPSSFERFARRLATESNQAAAPADPAWFERSAAERRPRPRPLYRPERPLTAAESDPAATQVEETYEVVSPASEQQDLNQAAS